MKIGIYCGQLFFPAERMHMWDENNLVAGGIGGSEIWAIELANKFNELGNDVVVFADCWNHRASNGVLYVSYLDFPYYSFAEQYDMFILSRRTDVDFSKIHATKTYLMAHDPRILYSDTTEELHLDQIDGIMYQSDWQKNMLIQKYPGIEEKRFFKTFQALNPELYADVDTYIKKNKMVWSSHKVRGVKFFIQRVMPLILQEVPDFELDVTGYIEDTTDDYFNAPHVNIKGCVTKDELIRLQKESKIWVYPNWGKFDNGWVIDETFCITAIENGLAENALFCADKTCFSTTLSGYNGFTGTELFDGDSFIMEEDKWDDFARLLADNAIRALKDEDYRQGLAKQAKKICLKYTWDNVAQSFLDAFNDVDVAISEFDDEVLHIFTLVTGPYTNYFPKFIESVKHFFPKNQKVIHIASDGLMSYNGYYDPVDKIKNVDVKHIIDLPFPLIPIQKTYMQKNYVTEDMKYVFYFDIDTVFLESPDATWDFLKRKVCEGNIIMSRHPHHDFNESLEWNLVEENPESKAYIPVPYHDHVISSFWGGKSTEVLKMDEQVNAMFKYDLKNVRYLPKFVDENYINRIIWQTKTYDDTGLQFYVNEHLIFVPDEPSNVETPHIFCKQKYDISIKQSKKIVY